MSELSEAGLDARRREVERSMGSCILKLQGYELLLKAILAEHRLSGSAAAPESIRADIERKTLGALVGQTLESFLVLDGAQGQITAPGSLDGFAIQIQVGLAPEDFARADADFRAFVTLRNDLVHHFLAQHDLMTEAGCAAALSALTLSAKQIDRAHADLRRLARTLENARRGMAQLLAMPAVRQGLVSGHFPWALTQVVQGLQLAETALAVEGWTRLAAAEPWMAQRFPGQEPKHYDCRSWRHLLHESRLFDLRYLQSTGKRELWYRSKKREAAP